MFATFDAADDRISVRENQPAAAKFPRICRAEVFILESGDCKFRTVIKSGKFFDILRSRFEFHSVE